MRLIFSSCDNPERAQPPPIATDHLGSTSLTADVNGNKVLEIRYKAWGEIRATWTSSPSTTPAYKMPLYQYTGQAAYLDDPLTSGVTEGFGLMFYQSRFYDPYLNHFVQADTIIPGGVQGLDRYAGMNNNPVVYADPSGHMATQDDGGTKYSYEDTQYDLKRIAHEQCEAGNNVDVNCSYGEQHPAEVATFAIGSWVGGFLIEGVLVYGIGFYGTTMTLIATKLALPMLVNGAIGGATSALMYGGMTILSGGVPTSAGIVGSFASGAIAGAISPIASPLAGGSMLGSSLINGLGSFAGYHGGIMAANFTNLALGQDANFRPTAYGSAVSFAAGAVLTPDISKQFPVRSINSVAQASIFMPGKIAATALKVNNLFWQTANSAVNGSLLFSAVGGNQ